DDIAKPWSISQWRHETASRILRSLRRRIEGGRLVNSLRVLIGGSSNINVEGPFIPDSESHVCLVLIVQVTCDQNYDHTYRDVSRWLETHANNDDCKKFRQYWASEPTNKHDDMSSRYVWSHEEIESVSTMARLEGIYDFDEDAEDQREKRREYNDGVLREARSTRGLGEPTYAADAASELLRKLFHCER
ncbi:MAG: hypothetical protein AAF497_17655, partial [Planctomycetota bacterium]